VVCVYTHHSHFFFLAGDVVAIKVIRRIERYSESAVVETDILDGVNKGSDPLHRGGGVLKLLGRFWWHGHFCMVTEVLGPSLYRFQPHRGMGFPEDCIRSFSKQLLTTLAHLHTLKLIHTDLKLENILLTSKEYAVAKRPPLDDRGRRVPVDNHVTGMAVWGG
jgi:serine/threonine protein kinase